MLEIHSVTRTFGDLTALNDVSFSVPDGRFTGFVGGNGAGKTTTMRIIMGVLSPTSGEVMWDGHPITADDRAQFGYMPEERGLYPKQPILGQLAYLGELHGMTAADAKAAARQLLERFNLGERTGDKLEKLSLGNQQRVQIAGAVIASPKALVLDEPFSGLDPEAVDEMFALLTEFTKRGVPVLFSSHQLELVERLCHQIVILRKGEVIASGSVEALRSAGPKHHRILAGADLGWLRHEGGVTVIDLDGPQAEVAFADDSVAQRVLAEAISRGSVHSFGPIVRPLSEYYREVSR
ncbi:ABC transporter ATP-binding protein [Tessaracoccus sp. MC1865]|uniref:ABC transporter ATP-binding protein n=1 Tax=Tessaracoccus sp. MC1865 TaxID=2760310 RepID=UPI001602932A|nr:ATP-binding cassette domain-containing protein [Tessaracoccus sp. MC1865]MBB1483647.1 ABC transporter ATP-binding protein [Tessaracoccus sp. MC1865]QTO36723.1 ATP-binding cassette domain-containing protein [Tessaracoccus sp. MC1865]